MLKGRLWRDGDFMKLWGGQSISELGSQISQLALPTVAILLLGATPFQVGLLTHSSSSRFLCSAWSLACTPTGCAGGRS